MTSGSLRNYYRDEIDDVHDNTSDGKSFKYKTKIVGKTPQRPERPPRTPQPPPNPEGSQPSQPPHPTVPSSNVEITIPLKYLTNFWIFLDLPVINCEIELDLSWAKDNTRGVHFMTTSTKLYVPLDSLSINDNIKF